MTRNIAIDQVDIILGIDAGQEFLKLSCSIIVLEAIHCDFKVLVEKKSGHKKFKTKQILDF